jgi:hypothetical protein
VASYKRSRGRSPLQRGYGLETASTGKDTSKVLSGTKDGGEEMLVMMPTELLDGLLSGLEAQSEMSEVLEEPYYDGLT